MQRWVILGMMIWLCMTSITTHAQTIQVVGPEWVHQMNKNNSDTLYIINFWGTWCKPCVQEMPGIDSIQTDYAHKKVKVLLVSTDMRKEFESGRLNKFVKERNVHADVLWMNEPDGEKWIPYISSGWSGLIPSTWILYRPGKFNYFREGEITYDQLKNIIDKQLK